MNKCRKSILGLISIAMLAWLGAGNIMAGELIDTSEAAFEEAFDGAVVTADITNPWWTLPAGSSFLYFAETEDGCGWNLLEVLSATTDNFNAPYDVDARIVLDREWEDEECEFETWQDVLAAIDAEELEAEEVTYDWYAQDKYMNIWYMGEDTWDGESNEGSFIAGCDDAEAGIVILGDPDKGDRYQQEFYEDEAEDWGKVLNFYGDDDDLCMKSKEWTPLEPGSVEHKFYCSDGETGVLDPIHELTGAKTVVVELIGTGVDTPNAPDSPPAPIPECED